MLGLSKQIEVLKWLFLESHVNSLAEGPTEDTVTSQRPAPFPAVQEKEDAKAWFQVLGGFLVFFNIWGLPNCFGAFQSFYALQYLSQYSASTISWIGTLQGTLLILLGLISGPLTDLGYYRTLLYVGSLLTVVGLMTLSLSTQYYQVFLSQGVCVGIGCGLLYVPTLSLIGDTFKAKRATAMALVTSGIALGSYYRPPQVHYSTILKFWLVGGVIYTIVFLQLIPKLGFPWTVRIIGFICLFAYILAIPALSVHSTKSSGRSRTLFDPSVLKDVPFLYFTLAQFFIFLGYLVPLFYIPTYAETVLKTTSSFSQYLLVICQSASLFGRLTASIPAQHVGVMPVWVFCCVISGVLCFTWIVSDSLPAFIAFCVLYGYFSGALIALPPSIFPVLCPDPGTLGARMGLSWTSSAISFLVGAPVAGALINIQTADFIGAQIWSGATLLIGSLFLVALWIMLYRKQKRVLI
ncbi:MFS transporter, MCP family, solute carrier family 16, member 10 [Xylaria arbuscula]|nr:MFS transporter, MCP family, solute carrier family 16, member 10 [Xylaria arbuscula]